MISWTILDQRIRHKSNIATNNKLHEQPKNADNIIICSSNAFHFHKFVGNEILILEMYNMTLFSELQVLEKNIYFILTNTYHIFISQQYSKNFILLTLLTHLNKFFGILLLHVPSNFGGLLNEPHYIFSTFFVFPVPHFGVSTHYHIRFRPNCTFEGSLLVYFEQITSLLLAYHKGTILVGVKIGLRL